MTYAFELWALVLSPLCGLLLLRLFYKRVPYMGEIANLLSGLAVMTVLVFMGMQQRFDQTDYVLNIGSLTPHIPLFFRLEPLGYIFACMSSVLWVVSTFYALFYMNSHDEKKLKRFYTSLLVSMSFCLGIALSGNFISAFFFYEGLSLSTLFLVLHRENDESLKAGRTYLIMLFAGSLLLLLPAIALTQTLAGTTSFQNGGILNGMVSNKMALLLFGLYIFGLTKAALMPLHGWLKRAMAAPTPVSAFLHAVAVVKAGAFLIIKMGIYIFGLSYMQNIGIPNIFAPIVLITIVGASFLALTQDNLKSRLAYSTISQLGYITLGVVLAQPIAIVAGILQLVSHAFAKITLFMCAGSIERLEKTKHISALDGLGYRLPFIFLSFFIASLSIIGIPLFAGFWVKWNLLISGFPNYLWVDFSLIISAFLSASYLLPIALRGFLRHPKNALTKKVGMRFQSLSYLPPLITSLGCIVIFFFYGPLLVFINKIPLI